MNNKNSSVNRRPAARKKTNNKKKANAFGKFVGGLFFFVLFYVVLVIFSALLLFLSVSCRHKDKQNDKAQITVVSEKLDEKSGTVKPISEIVDSSAVNDVAKEEHSAYLPVSVFETLGADITPAGDPLKSITVHLNDVDEAATFTVNSNKVSVNGMDITLNAKAVIRDGELYIPIDFFETQLNGVSVTLDDDGYTVKKNGLGQISFVNKPAEPTPSVVEDEYFDDEPIKFKADLSKYEQYMNPENRDDYLYVVNINNLLSEDFVPEDLRDVQYTKPDRAKQQMCLNAQMAVDAMLKEARQYGFTNLWVTSAYRSYQTQSWLFENEINSLRSEYGDEAEEKAKESVNPPGASEHQSGLTADIHSLSSASSKFDNTEEAKWLAENAQYFGFILRYPADKTEITGIMYESWHFRYVGRYHAMQMKHLGMCLEEYVEYLK